ncbi:MAG: bifunctional DNA primase/polymerase [Pseudonocardiaceae bacterium]
MVIASDGGEMDWTETWRDAFRTELRAEAIGFARHGWPVVPGSYPRGSHWVGMPSSLRTGAGQHGAVPVHSDWRQLAGCGPERVAELWSGHPFSVLLATGMGLDALDLPAALGRATANRAASCRCAGPHRRHADRAVVVSGVRGWRAAS